MSTEMHPIVAEVLRTAEQIQTMADAQVSTVTSGSFTGTDESETVRVTVDGRQWLKSVSIEDGLLRLGLETVALRVNEAMLNAQNAAAAVIDAEEEQLLQTLGELADSITATVDSADPKPL
jgi:DNA-binding protein YbaB